MAVLYHSCLKCSFVREGCKSVCSSGLLATCPSASSLLLSGRRQQRDVHPFQSWDLKPGHQRGSTGETFTMKGHLNRVLQQNICLVYQNIDCYYRLTKEMESEKKVRPLIKHPGATWSTNDPLHPVQTHKAPSGPDPAVAETNVLRQHWTEYEMWAQWSPPV